MSMPGMSALLRELLDRAGTLLLEHLDVLYLAAQNPQGGEHRRVMPDVLFQVPLPVRPVLGLGLGEAGGRVLRGFQRLFGDARGPAEVGAERLLDQRPPRAGDG